MRVKARADDGQVLLLVLVYALVGAALVMVVVDVSKLFLYRRSLSGVADGVALAAAQSLDRAVFYREGADATLPLDRQEAAAAIERYVELNRLEDRYPDFTVGQPQLSDDGRTVTVRVRCRMELPFTGSFTGGDRFVDVEVVASAEAATQ